MIKVCSYFLYRKMLYINPRLKLNLSGEDNLEKALAENKSVIFVFWHGATFMLFYAYKYHLKKEKLHILTSTTFRGRVIGRLAQRYFGFKVSYSSHRKGLQEEIKDSEALNTALKEGYNTAIPAEGLEGPCQEAEAGAVHLSFESKVPIVPVGAFAEKKYTSRRWDKYFVPYPNSKAAIVIGEAIDPPQELNNRMIEYKRRQIERSLDQATKEAERLVK